MYVPSSAAFFRVWRFTRRILLLVSRSYVSLASCSTPLRVYVLSPNNHIHLASFRGPHSANSVALSAFNSIPEQSFAFYIKEGFEPSPIPVKMELLYHWAICDLLRCAAPVAPYLVRYRIQHTYCFLPCGLLNGSSSLPSSVQLLHCYHAFPCGSDSVATC